MSRGMRSFYSLTHPGQKLYIPIFPFNSTTDGILANLVGGDVARRDLEAAAAKRLPAPPTLSHVSDDDNNDGGDSDQMGRETPV